ncbi:MAG TPA: LCP family protein, partial [Actinomycetes bacterium]|nr:LCP family protein [Actinomycetes bacterium]
MSDQPGGEENEPVESEYEPAPPPAPMAYDQALAAARQAGSTPAESVRAVETSGAVESAETESSDVKPAPEPVISPAAAAAATALPTDGPATPAPAAEDQLAPADKPAEAMPGEAKQGLEPVTSPAAASLAPPGKPGMPTPPAEDRAEPAGDRGESAEDQASPAHEQPPPGDEQAEPAEDRALPGDEQAPSVATLRIAAAVERDNAVPAAHTEAGLVTEPVVDRSGNVLGVMYKPAPSQGVEHGSDHPPRPIYYYVEDEPPAKTGRRRRALIIVLVSLLALSACTVGGAWWLSERFASQVHRIPRVFDIPEQERPDKPQEGAAAKALNFLLAGTDRRSDLATTGDDAAAPIWVAGAQRSDTIILVHLSADRKKAYVISFPRDSWVDIP